MKLLECKTINDISLVCYYENGIAEIMLFNLTEQPNLLSASSPYTTWGYLTYKTGGMYSLSEAAEVVSLYLQDMEKGNIWWESV